MDYDSNVKCTTQNDAYSKTKLILFINWFINLFTYTIGIVNNKVILCDIKYINVGFINKKSKK